MNMYSFVFVYTYLSGYYNSGTLARLRLKGPLFDMYIDTCIFMYIYIYKYMYTLMFRAHTYSYPYMEKLGYYNSGTLARLRLKGPLFDP
jgi:hypothetical protein